MTVPGLTSDLVLAVLEGGAVVASAIAGMIVASNKGMDLIGAFALACLNAFGGGTIRDLLLDNRPFYWAAHWGYLAAILCFSIPFVYSVSMFRIAKVVHKRSVKMDAVGLALFTIAGTGIALARGSPLVIAVLMGVITGTSGGVLRDVVVNEVPDLFRPGGLYASASFAGALAFALGLEFGMQYTGAVFMGVAIVVLLRLVSVRFNLAIPAAQWTTSRGDSDS